MEEQKEVLEQTEQQAVEEPVTVTSPAAPEETTAAETASETVVEEDAYAMPHEEASLTVVMETKFLYDFFLYHAYSKAMGFLTNICGFSFFIMGGLSYWFGLIDGRTCGFIVVCSILFLANTPYQLHRKAKKAMQEPMYQQPLEYTFSDDNGITVKSGESVRNYSWDEMEKAVVAPKTIDIYLTQNNALILPKESFTKEVFLIIYPMIERHLRLRYHQMAMEVRAKKEEAAKSKEK